MTAAEPEIQPNYSTRLIGYFLGKAAVRLFIFPVFLLGCWVGGAGLHDPDTCWLAALGRVIFQTGKLPSTDPFSYTFAMGTPKPFIMYQWLTELIFYTCIHFGGLLLLLFVAATTLYIAFICLPLLAFDRLQLPRLRSFTLIIITMVAASFHFLVRPEIFSYLVLSSWLSTLMVMRSATKKTIESNAPSKVDWKIVGIFSALMILWCNLHTGFTSGLIVLTIYCIASSSDWLFLGKKQTTHFPHKTAWISLVGAFAATLFNPNGYHLWEYIQPLFFSPINKYIVELKPVGLKSLLMWIYYPFFILILVSVWDYLRAWRTKSGAYRLGWFSPIFIVTLIVLGFQHSRIIPFSSMCLMFEEAWMCSQFTKIDSPPISTIDFMNARMKQLFSPDLRWLVLHGVLVIFGAWLIAIGPVKPHLPTSSTAFQFPEGAIEYLRQSPPTGHGFNSPQFGDLLIWYLQPCPKLFIDTRFDMYGPDLVNNYMQIAECRDGWQNTLGQYDVKWFFVEPDLPIAKQLAHTAGWRQAYSSKQAVIYVER